MAHRNRTHRRMFVPGNIANLQKTLPLGLCLLGRNCLRFTNVASKSQHFRVQRPNSCLFDGRLLDTFGCDAACF